jgi:glutamyl-tRNA synthetase
MSSVRTRFPPSPTGFLHVGGVRTALFNYLFAKKHGGQFILRLEDTDRERFVPEGVEQIVHSLDWLGLHPDEGFWISEGQHHSIEYVQSERHKRGFYQQHAEKLLAKGLLYRDWTSPEQIAGLRRQAQQARQPFIFRKTMAELDGDPARPHVLRFDVMAQAKASRQWQNFVTWDDAVRGKLQVHYDTIDDFVAIKSDGFPTYNFANVIDDHDMRITHVLRGQDIIPSTPKHLLLYEACGFALPVFAHLPVINGPDGQKLSKRSGDTNVLDYRDNGCLPAALLNFLALLGWNDGTEQEIFSLDELVSKFSLERIGASPAVFDPKRLDWISGHHMRALPLDELFEKARNFWPDEAASAGDEYKKQVLGLVRERLKYFAELPALTRFFFVDLPVDPRLISDHKQLKKLSSDELHDLLEKVRAALEQSTFEVADLTQKLNSLLEETGQKPAVLFSLIRIATTQAPASPGLAGTLAVLGKQRSLARLDSQLSALTD